LTDQMQRYFGAKGLEARPMTRAVYCTYRGWELPADENGADEGMLVRYEDGYESWSPMAQFNAAYRPVNALTFGQATEAAKLGKKIGRAGWNGKGMFVYYVAAGRYPPVSEPAKEIAAGEPDARVPYRSYLAMKTVTGEVVPWLASQSDVLEDDWEIVE
jgi:hypothetical protein